jgi:Na+-transporting NADH:ubiquinone oxidoreductase subunit A
MTFMFLQSWRSEDRAMSKHIKIAKGLDLSLGGEPEQSVHPGPDIRHVALLGEDYIGLKPRLLVSEGDVVARGQPLFIDKRDPDISYCSPAQGVIAAINRGPRRVLDSIVVRLEDSGVEDIRFDPLSDEQRDTIGHRQVLERLQQSGLWRAFRTRPFSRVPLSDSSPNAIFVTATDTRPLSADPAVVVRTDSESFISGLRLLSLLTAGPVYLCTGPGWDIETPDINQLERVTFSGPHPAGLPGTHIHKLYPVDTDRVAWQIDYQDVMAIGKLFTEGTVPTSRVVALGGECLVKPRLVKTLLGASTNELLADGFRQCDGCRVLSGSVLDGRAASDNLAYLGRYHNQVSVIPEGGERRLFGWLGKNRRHRRSTSQNGRFAGMIPVPVFEKLMPLDILPSVLFRALLVKDSDQAQALGCLELDEEDLALCAYMCPAKTDYGHALRINLDQIEREG